MKSCTTMTQFHERMDELAHAYVDEREFPGLSLNDVSNVAWDRDAEAAEQFIWSIEAAEEAGIAS